LERADGRWYDDDPLIAFEKGACTQMARIEYVEPQSIDEVLATLDRYGDEAKILAGGQSLLVLLRDRLIEPRILVALQGVPGLDHITANGDLSVGAMATHTSVQMHPAVRARWPLLAEAEAAVSAPQIRNRGTLVGNVAHAFPTADPPAALIALGAQVRLRSSSAERTLPIEDFFIGLMQTALTPTELVTEIVVPGQPAGAGGAYLKYAMRPLDFSIVGVGARVVLAADGTCSEARIGLNGAGDIPLRARRAEDALWGRRLLSEPDAIDAAAELAAADSDPVTDIDGSAEYKRKMVRVFVRRALRQALAVAT
jgi:carbon-monoxide dehydrogenase medium subunit